MRRQLVVLALVGVALLLGAGTAFAHNVLVTSDPADGSSVATGPSRVTLTFDLPVQEGFAAITVIGPDGLRFQHGPAAVDSNVVSMAVNPLGPAGRYTIGYRVVSGDGHPVSGSVGFTLTKAGTGRGVPGPTPGSGAAATAGSGAGSGSGSGSGEGGVPAWPWIVGAVILVAGGAALAIRAGRT